MSVVPHAQHRKVLNVILDRMPKRATVFGPTLFRNRNSEADRSGPVGAQRPTDLATSREFANLLAKVAPDTQSLCISAPGGEVPLITLKLKVTNDLSLRALVDCGASNIFIRRQSLEGRRLKYIERDISLTRMTVLQRQAHR